jgi:hypothetical protein
MTLASAAVIELTSGVRITCTQPATTNTAAPVEEAAA